MKKKLTDIQKRALVLILNNNAVTSHDDLFRSLGIEILHQLNKNTMRSLVDRGLARWKQLPIKLNGGWMHKLVLTKAGKEAAFEALGLY